MPLEIERKFLIANDGWRQLVSHSKVMRQGYLGAVGGKASIRVRLHDEEARLNIKASVVGSSRAEYEYEIPSAEAQEILDTLCVGRIDKTRHYVELGHDNLVWEIDEFHGENDGLIVAEIELTDAQQDFARPPWLGKEVTEEKRYYNHALAQCPFRSWNESGN